MDYKIRMATPADAPALLAIYAPYITETDISFEYTVPTLEEFRQRIVTVLTRFPYLVAEREGEILGYVYASPFKIRAAYAWSVETSIYIRRDCRANGIGSALYTRLEELLIRQNIINANAYITYPNEPSECFHKRWGYHETAHYPHIAFKGGNWLDLIAMEKMLCPLPTEPKPVIPITQLPL